MTDFLDEEKVEAWLNSRDKLIATQARYRQRHPDRLKATKERYNASDKGQQSAKAYGARYRAERKDTAEYKEKNRLGVRRWREADPNRAKASREKYLANPETRAKAYAAVKAWREAHPDHVKAWSFNNYHANRKEQIAKVIEWQRNNPGKVRVRYQNYKARKRDNGGVLSADIVETLMKRQRGKCVICKVKLTPKNRHLDHIMPLKLGGPNTDENVQLLCASCNCSKRATHPIEYMQSRGFLL